MAKKVLRSVQVAYGTDRARSRATAASTFYLGERGQRLELGFARVLLPKGAIADVAAATVDDALDIAITHADFVNKLGLMSEHTRACVFVHGYNVSFENAITTTAALVSAMKLDVVPLAYSWPTRERPRKSAYNKDRETVQGSAAFFLDFLELLSNAGYTTDIVAHSMGCRAVLAALSTAPKSVLTRVRVTAYVAADVDRDVFKNWVGKFAPDLRRITAPLRNTTLYASRHDKAMFSSAKLNGYGRAGSTRPEPLVDEHFDTIDASAVEARLFGLNHSYHLKRPLLVDMRDILKSETPPGARLGTVEDLTLSLPHWILLK